MDRFWIFPYKDGEEIDGRIIFRTRLERAARGPETERAGRGPETERAGRGPESERAGRGPESERAGRGPDTERAARGPESERAARGPESERAGRGPDTERAARGPKTERAARAARAARGARGAGAAGAADRAVVDSSNDDSEQKPSVGPCFKRQQSCNNKLGSFCPKCDSNGAFLPQQCSGSTGYCWCVIVTTGEPIPGTKTPPWKKPVNCEGPCIKQKQNCTNLPGSFCPRCDDNGDFLPCQCSGSTGFCWCVNITTGESIPCLKNCGPFEDQKRVSDEEPEENLVEDETMPNDEEDEDETMPKDEEDENETMPKDEEDENETMPNDEEDEDETMPNDEEDEDETMPNDEDEDETMPNDEEDEDETKPNDEEDEDETKPNDEESDEDEMKPKKLKRKYKEEASNEESDKDEENKDSCSENWSSFEDQCFSFINSPKTWAEAEFYCQFEGGNLASVHSQEENHFIQALTKGDSHDFPETWIGGTDAIQLNFWLWADGSKFNYENWVDKDKDGEDDEEKDERCLKINYEFNLKWTTASCNQSLPFVCSKSKEDGEDDG